MAKVVDQHFKRFALVLEKEIKKYRTTNTLEFQKKQVENLVKAENDFKAALIDHPFGEVVYKDFIRYILEERKNILVARPYFRERQVDFTNQISKILKDRNYKELYRFNFNWNFVQFALKSQQWPPGSRVVQLSNKIKQIRTQLIIMNMPLAISRAKKFYSATPKSQLTYMDLVQISVEGLMTGIDKFVLPYSSVFRSVVIGRITGDFIESYSKPMLYFYPGDKRKLYRANKVLNKFNGNVDYNKLSVIINDGMVEAYKTNPDEIAALIAAASSVSTETAETQEDDKPIAQYSAAEETRPDTQVENLDAQIALKKAVSKLTIFESKFLRLKGINLDFIGQ